jgi:two-component system cell cycle sensor histidine kinase/response regulator CckA
MKSRKRVIEDIKEIVEEKHPEQGLREALDYANSIIETIHDSLLVLDADLRVVSANEAFYETFELTPSHTEGKLIYELGNGQWDIPELRELLEEILPKNTAFNDFEVDHEFPSIGRRVMLLNARRMLSRGQKTRRILLAIREITARKQTEQALQQADSRLDIKNRIADIFLTVPDDEMYGEVLQVILKAIRSRYGIFGYIDELGNLVIPSMTRDIWQKCKVPDKTIVYPPENWGGIWGRALKEKKTLYANRGLHVPEGHIPVVRVLVVPILYSGELIGLLEVANKGTAYDDEDKSYLETLANYIAPVLNARLERDKQEKERKLAEHELAASELQYRRLFEAANDGILIVNADTGQIEDINPFLLDMVGFSKREIIGKKLWEIGMLKHAELSRERFRILQDKKYVRYEDLPLETKDSRQIDVEFVSNVYEVNGKKVIQCNIRDISERKELDRLKDEFIGMVSHELSRPLTVIAGCLNTVLDEATKLSEQERSHLLRNAALQTDAMTHLLGNLLELARVQAERLILHAEPIEVSIVAKNVVERITEQYPTHKYSLDFPAELPTVDADPVRLERILYNLLDNARKYSQEGSEVKVFAKADNDNVIIGVTDQGVGIATSNQDKIFVAFERLEQSGFKRTTGIGLGLLVCRRLVEAHSGRIWVESAPGKGSTFFFSLPCKRTG